MIQQFRKIANEMIMAGVQTADPNNAIRSQVRVEDKMLHVQGDSYSLEEYDRVLLFAIGKAATPMASSFEQILTPDDGVVITKKGEEIDLVEVKSVATYEAFHPAPKQENVTYSTKILDMVDSIQPDEKALVVFLISGGGSALFSAPPAGISIEDMYDLNQLLMKCGATIRDINAIRKHVTQVKGGMFGKRVSDKGATLISLILSDVIGDDMSVIASGPTYKDGTTFADAISLLEKFKIWDETPASIRKHLQAGLKNPSWEPPRQIPANVHNYLIGNNMSALRAAEEVAKKEGFNSLILTSQNHGEAKIVAKSIMAIAKEVQDSGNPLPTPAALIMGGEMIVTFDWEDRDGFGPNREFVLSSAMEIEGRRNIVVAGADTDGVDGEGKAGAIADGDTIGRASLDPHFHLDRHEAEAFFDHLDDSIVYSSRTNVNDINVILIGEK